METKRKDKAASLSDGRTPKEVVDNIRRQAREAENYRNRPEVRRAIARNPKVLQSVREMERLAAEFWRMADDFEANFGHLSDAEFAFIQARADELARNHAQED